MTLIKGIMKTFICALTFAGISTGNALAQSQKLDADKIRKDCPDLDEKSVQELANIKPGPEAHGSMYAHMFCVPLAEAARRTTLQNKNMGLVQKVTSEIIKNESETYVNHWARHHPDYRLVVEFTENAEETLAKYTEDPYFLGVNRPGDNKLTKERKSQDIIGLLQQWKISIGMAGFDYKTGKYDVRLVADKEEFIREKAAEEGTIIPDWVNFIPPLPFPHKAPKAINPERLKAFPRYKKRHSGFQTAVGVPDIEATLRLIDGCLVIETETEKVPGIWPKNFAADMSEPDRVGVISLLSGTSIYQDEKVIISGLQPGPRDNVRIRNGRPDLWSKVADNTDGPCKAPYIQIDSLVRKSDFETQILEAHVKYFVSQGMTEIEAKAEAKRQRKVSIEINQLIKSLEMTHKDIFAGGFGSFNNFAPPPGTIGHQTASLFIKGEVDTSDLIPSHLTEYFRVQTVPRSLAEGEMDIKFLKDKLGQDARINFSPFDGKILIESVTDLKRLSKLLVEMGPEWPEYFKYNIGAGDFTPDYDMPDAARASEMRKTKAYKKIYELALKQRPNQGFHRLDRAVVKALHFGLTAEYIVKLEAEGMGPISAQIDYRSEAARQKDAIFSDLIVTAQPMDYDTSDDRGDGFRSTVTFKVLDVAKGPAQPDQIIKVRFHSGEDKDGNHVKIHNEPHILPGFNTGLTARKKWKLFLSKKGYEQRERYSTALNPDEDIYMLSGRVLPSN